jgi:phosphatidate cytidylyltransferase
MLWKRVATAVVLLPLVLLALFKLPAEGIAVLIGGAVMVASWEMSALIGFNAKWQRWSFNILILTSGIAGSLWQMQGHSIVPILAIAFIWWIYAVIHVASEKGDYGGIFATITGRSIAGILVMVPTWLAFLNLYIVDGKQPLLLLNVLVLVWVADSFAYFTGRAWGRHKLAPAVSPGKSVEGVVGGMIGVLLVAILASHYLWGFTGYMLVMWIIVSLVTGVLSVVGDLTESIFKRRVGVKDSGHLLPGHGGMYDRIDALTSAIPVFALGWILMLSATG